MSRLTRRREQVAATAEEGWEVVATAEVRWVEVARVARVADMKAAEEEEEELKHATHLVVPCLNCPRLRVDLARRLG